MGLTLRRALSVWQEAKAEKLRKTSGVHLRHWHDALSPLRRVHEYCGHFGGYFQGRRLPNQRCLQDSFLKMEPFHVKFHAILGDFFFFF